MNKIKQTDIDEYEYTTERTFSKLEDDYLSKAQEKIFKLIDNHPNQKQLEWVYYDIIQEIFLSTMNHFNQNEEILYKQNSLPKTKNQRKKCSYTNG